MTARARHPRVTCSVEGCPGYSETRETLPEGHSWLETGGHEGYFICGRHWRRVPRSLKRRRTALVRQWRRLRKRTGVDVFWELRPGSPERIRWVRLERLIRATWSKCVRVAAGDDAAVGEGGVPAGLGEELRRLGL